MNKKIIWISIIVAVVFAGGGFYGGMTYAASKSPAARFAAAGGAAGFAGRGAAGAGAAGFGGAGGATIGTILSEAAGSITIQLPTSTSTTATTGSKIVLINDSTQIDELESVPSSNLKVGQSVTVSGTANSDGSMTATSIQVRPAGAGGARQ